MAQTVTSSSWFLSSGMEKSSFATRVRVSSGNGGSASGAGAPPSRMMSSTLAGDGLPARNAPPSSIPAVVVKVTEPVGTLMWVAAGAWVPREFFWGYVFPAMVMGLPSAFLPMLSSRQPWVEVMMRSFVRGVFLPLASRKLMSAQDTQSEFLSPRSSVFRVMEVMSFSGTLNWWESFLSVAERVPDLARILLGLLVVVFAGFFFLGAFFLLRSGWGMGVCL